MSWSMEHVRDAAVSPEDVFAAYVDPSTWGVWGHNTRWARLEGPFREGARVQVCAGYRKVWPVDVRLVVPGRTVVCEVRPPGATIVSTYDVRPIAGGARLRHVITLSGRLELGYRLLRPLYLRLLAKETKRLVELVSRETAPRSTPVPAPPETS
jgi:uncharacterized protein YndB with AHSA1/START domain